VIKSQTFRHN